MKPPLNPLRFLDSHTWRAWLEEHHVQEREAWLLIPKSQSHEQGITLREAIEEALCFGWVDSLMQPIDAGTYALRFTPRKPKSIWSKVNRDRVEQLISQGKMTEAGLAKVREAQASGEWDMALRREDTSVLPDELAGALAARPDIQAKFEALPRSQKKVFLNWINAAKTDPTRQRRIREMLEMLEQGRRLGQQPGEK